MLPVATKTAIITRLSCNLLNEIRTKPIVLRHAGHPEGYVSSATRCTVRTNQQRILLSSFVNNFSTTSLSYSTECELSIVRYEKICNETLDSLTEYFEELIEVAEHLPDADVTYSDGVLTVQFGNPYGTYVLNRQTPNKQIWLSSPKSGPKRYDFRNGRWVYKHDGKSLHELLNNEIPTIVKAKVCFDNCSFSGKEK